jgi:ribonucleoside-diphosphate reductase beta chain
LTEILTAANWSQPDDGFTQMFYEQNVKQFWLPEEIALAGDVLTWKTLSRAEQTTYMRVLGGLTLLDTVQGDVGMPNIASVIDGHQRKAVLNFMAMMENAVHAKSYSNIFLTLATKEEIDATFEWVEGNPYLQRKAQLINRYYTEISENNIHTVYRALVASVFLESFLFYSGFYYPLYFAGQGKLTNSGEIIALIIRDEAIHGVYVGLLAQEIYNAKDSEATKKMMHRWVVEFLTELYENEVAYTEELYADVGLAHDVKRFLRYNANKALTNLGFPPHFEDEPQNPVVINGLNTKTKSHDFFSQKGNGYKKATVEPLLDSDFYFEEATQ